MVTEIILVLNGLAHAGLLFVLGSGLTLAFGLMRVVNLSHGAFYLLGGYLGLTVFRVTDNWWLALLAGGLGIALVTMLIQIAVLAWVFFGGEPRGAAGGRAGAGVARHGRGAGGGEAWRGASSARRPPGSGVAA